MDTVMVMDTMGITPRKSKDDSETRGVFAFLGAVAVAFALLGLLANTAFAASPVHGTEHNRNLRGLDYMPMLLEYHRHTIGEGRQFFAYPARDTTFRTHFNETEARAMASIADTIGDVFVGGPHVYAVAVSPILGIDFRGGEALDDTIWPGVDAGLYIRGFADSLDFDLDARMYSEAHSAGVNKGAKRKPKSYDGEVFDVQSENSNDGGADYVSYSRYRAHLGLNYAFARLELARDVMHWGPGYYNNLSLNQFALPYNMISLDFKFGPLHVLSAYADLRVNSWSYSKDNLNDRNLYAHRYELNLFKNDLVVGISELQILYNENKPWLFVPVVPLFIEKGNYTERVNNGALSMDLNYRLFNTARIYGEFFLDDLESPMAVYENKYSNNRWAAMAGMQVSHDFYLKEKKIEAGTIAEIARVEPYTYGHYDTAMAQMAHLGMPLGNPNGPNSLSIDWAIYGRMTLDKSATTRSIFMSYRSQWLWKGDDYGSSIDDPYKWAEKHFIHGAKMHYNGTVVLDFRGVYVGFMGEYTFGSDPAVNVRTTLMW